MEFVLRHPRRSGVVAHYGFDPRLGFWVSVRGLGGGEHEYNGLRGEYKQLQGALEYLAALDFFTESELRQAQERLAHQSPEEMSSELRPVAEVVRNFKTAGG